MRKCFFIFLFCLNISSFFGEEKEYLFEGNHLIANYLECDKERLQDVEALIAAMHLAVKECGATVLGQSQYIFPGNGLTMVILLSESHASIHTYPEHTACFVDLFTCGDKCDHAKFDAILRQYLQPKQVIQEVVVRNEKLSILERK